MNVISFNLANYVARATGFKMTEGWGQGDRTTQDHYRPVDTYAERLEPVLSTVRRLGFGAIDLWTPFLDPAWATEQHAAIFCALLSQYELKVASLAGWMGSTAEQFEALCRLARDLDTRILGGDTTMIAKDRPFVIAKLAQYDCVLGYENHPEKAPAELLEKLGEHDNSRIGVTLDTGWFGTQGYDAAQAIRELAGRIHLVHLKDVRAVGAHDTCRYGHGVVDIPACVRALREVGYAGPISIEHEPGDFDPTDDIGANLRLLQRWLSASP